MRTRDCAMRSISIVFVLALSGSMSSSAVWGYSAAADDKPPAVGKAASPKDALDYFNSAIANMKGGNTDQALVDIDKAIALEPQLSSFHTFRGYLNQSKGKYELALRDCDTAIKIDPKDDRAYLTRGECHQAMKNVDKAVQDFDKAVEIDPKNADAYRKRGSFYFGNSDYDNAKKDLDKAIELDPKGSEAYMYRSVCHGLKRDYASSLGDLSTAVDLQPDLEPGYRETMEKAVKKVREISPNSVRFLSFTPDKALQREVVGRSTPKVVSKGVEEKSAKEHTISRSVSMTSQIADAKSRGLLRAWWHEVERGCQFVESRMSENRGNEPRTIRREAKFVGDGTTAVSRVETVLYRTGTVKIKVGDKTSTIPVRYESDFDCQFEKIADK